MSPAYDKASAWKGIVAAIVLASSAGGVELQIQYGGRGSGFLGDTAFDDQQFIVTASLAAQDWSPLQVDNPNAEVYAAPHLEATVWIEGLGEFDFVTRTGAFVNQTTGILGITRLNDDLAPVYDIYHGPVDTRFQDWDRASDIGAIFGDGQLLQWGRDEILTTEGVLFFEDTLFVPVGVGAVAVEVEGDYNFDRLVNAADFVVYRDGAGPGSGDDYGLWVANFQPVASDATAAAVAAVPEPGAAALLLLGLGIAVAACRSDAE